jgi:hypothetical protein
VDLCQLLAAVRAKREEILTIHEVERYLGHVVSSFCT